MKPVRVFFQQYVPYLLCIAILSLLNCHLIFPFGVADPPATPRFDCETKVFKCKTVHKNLQATLVKPKGCYQLLPASTGQNPGVGLRNRIPVYCDKNWVFKYIGLPQLRGAMWIRTRYADANNNDMEFMKIRFLDNHTESVYIAYDTRAVKPGWLKSKYYRLWDGLNNMPFFITISKPTATTKDLKLEIWKRKPGTIPLQNDEITIEANSYGNPGWGSIPQNDRAMYIVIIKPKEDFDCTKLEQIFKEFYDNCTDDNIDTEQKAKNAALQACEKELETYQYKNHVCVQPKCDDKQDCPEPDQVSQNYGLQIQPRSFPGSSEIEFDHTKYSPSLANIVIDKGNKQTSNVTAGTIHFEYLLNNFNAMWKMKINSMILELAPLRTQAGNFTNIIVALLAPIIAECTDASPPWATPCTNYVIPPDTLVVSVATDLDEGKLFNTARNKGPFPIIIDHLKHTFRIKGGPLTTTVNVNDKDRLVEIDIDLLGHFLNFAPTAVTEESTKFVECVEDLNQLPITLDSTNSFDAYDTIPANAYRWYEDYGLTTEKLLSEKPIDTIAPLQFEYGIHEITLVIKDAHGVAGKNTFRVEVGDTKPPELTIPQDIYMFPIGFNPVEIDIGQADASDICSDNVMISNNAPEDRIFQPGAVHSVAWKADDGRGNIRTKVQKIHLFSAPSPDEMIFSLNGSIKFNVFLVEECKTRSECPVDLQPLINAIDQMNVFIEEMSFPEGQEERKPVILGRQAEAKGELLEAASFIVQSLGRISEEERIRLLSSAVEHLEGAIGLVNENMLALQPSDLVMPFPESQILYDQEPAISPFLSDEPDKAHVVGLGTIARGGDTLSLHLNSLQFPDSVDVYFAVYAPALDALNVYILKADNTFQSHVMGIEPWKADISIPPDWTLFGDIPLSFFPAGPYFVFVLIAPAGSLETYYVWSTLFEVP